MVIILQDREAETKIIYVMIRQPLHSSAGLLLEPRCLSPHKHPQQEGKADITLTNLSSRYDPLSTIFCW